MVYPAGETPKITPEASKPTAPAKKEEAGQEEKPVRPRRKSYPLRYDPDFSARSMGHNIFTGYNLGIDYVLEPLAVATRFENNGFGRLFVAIVYEAWALYAGGVQHEIGGHGGRYREIGCSPHHDMWPFPIKFGQITKYNCSFTLNLEQDILTAMGGTEATQVLANITSRQMMLHGANVAKAIGYLDFHLDLSNYIGVWNNPGYSDGSLTPFTEDENNYPEHFGDIHAYWKYMSGKELAHLKQFHTLKEIHANNLWTGPNFSYNNIRAGAIWNAADPLTLFLAYQVLRYVFTGNKEFEIPDFLPRTNFVLSPEGPEYYLTLPFRVKETLFEPYLRSTFNYDKNAYGAGLDVFNIPIPIKSSHLVLEAGTHVWNAHQGPGVSASLGVHTNILGKAWRPLEKYYLSGGVIVKTDGYVFGQPLEQGGSWFVGLTYIAPVKEDK